MTKSKAHKLREIIQHLKHFFHLIKEPHLILNYHGLLLELIEEIEEDEDSSDF